MITEIDHGVDFLCTLLLSKGADERKSRAFCDALRVVLSEHFSNHWDPEYPNKGSGYRCIRIHHDRAEPLVDRAAFTSKTPQVLELLPSELTLWFDPTNVSYRIGENNGRIKTIYYAGAKEHQPTPTLSALSPPHTPVSHAMVPPAAAPLHMQSHTAPIYVPEVAPGMGGRHTASFSRSPPGQPMYNPYSKSNGVHHNPHNLLMAAR